MLKLDNFSQEVLIKKIKKNVSAEGVVFSFFFSVPSRIESREYNGHLILSGPWLWLWVTLSVLPHSHPAQVIVTFALLFFFLLCQWFSHSVTLTVSVTLTDCWYADVDVRLWKWTLPPRLPYITSLPCFQPLSCWSMHSWLQLKCSSGARTCTIDWPPWTSSKTFGEDTRLCVVSCSQMSVSVASIRL